MGSHQQHVGEDCSIVGEEWFRRFFDASAEGILLLDENGFIECNRAYRDLMGISDQEDIRRLHPADVSPPFQPDGRSSREKADEILRLACEQETQRFDWLSRRRDGSEFTVEILLTCVSRPGQPPLLQAVLRDVTERRRQEDQLSENERRLRLMVENLPAGAVHREGNRLYMNKAAEVLTGYSREDIRCMDDWFEVLYGRGERARKARAQYEEDRAEGFPHPRTLAFQRADHRERFAEVAAYRWDDQNEVWVFSDVTERVCLEENEAHERQILEQITSGSRPLPEILGMIAAFMEHYTSGLHCAIFVREGDRLRLHAAPTLPPAYARLIETLEVDAPPGGPADGILATLRATVPLVANRIEEHFAWNGGAIALAHGITSCIAQPIRSAPGGEALGALAFFSADSREPDAQEMHLLQMAAHVSSLAIHRRQSEEALRRANDELEARVRERTAELEAERARLETILQQMPAGVVIAEAETGRPVLMNDQVARIWRCTEEREQVFRDATDIRVIGRESLLKPDLTTYEEGESPLARTLLYGDIVTDAEFAILRCDGTRGVVRTSSAPITDRSGGPNAVVFTLQDITDLKNTEEALRRLHDELELQVQERTAELAQTNRSLQAEVKERLRAEQVSRGQTETMIRTLNALTSAAGGDSMVDHVLSAICQQLQADGIVSWLHDPVTESLVMQFGYADGEKMDLDALRERGIATRMSGELLSSWHRVRLSRRPYLIEDIATEPVVVNREALLAAGVKSVLIVPLFLGGEAIGTFSIFSRQQLRYHEEEFELAQALAHQASLAVQLQRLSVRERHTAVLQERNRLAREIHDTLAQGFTSIIIHLQLAEAAMTKKPEKALPALLQARDIAKNGLAEARRSVWALRPNALEGSSLADGLLRLAESMVSAADAAAEGSGGGVRNRPRVEVKGTPRALPADTESHLLRLGQEALNNALKYAEASEICVQVSFDLDKVRLTVRDNGRGFDKNDRPRGSGFGHIGMRERVAALRGELVIETAPGNGTEITVIVPV